MTREVRSEDHRPLPTYVDEGTGFPIVFSHGALMSHQMFEPQIAYLS